MPSCNSIGLSTPPLKKSKTSSSSTMTPLLKSKASGSSTVIEDQVADSSSEPERCLQEVREFLESGKATGMYLQVPEWNALQGKACGFLRSFKPSSQEGRKIAVLIRNASDGEGSGHEIRGVIELESVTECTNTRTISQCCPDMYSNTYLKCLQKQKVYFWKLKDLVAFDEPILYTDGAVKFKNRTFQLSNSFASLGSAKGPKHQTLGDVAAYFFELMSEASRAKLEEGARAADQRCIRVGTTCSGSDVCVSVLRECVAFLNKQFNTDIRVEHIFSCELDSRKRNLILEQHSDVRHCFSDVEVFRAGRGFCHVCGCEHSTGKDLLAIDWFYVGPSCKDVSTLNNHRHAFGDCYKETFDPTEEEGAGTSGPTFQKGCKKVPWFPSVIVHVFF